MKDSIIKRVVGLLTFASAFWLTSGACVEFYNIAWGTGGWLGQFSPKWFFLFLSFALICIFLLVALGFVFWSSRKLAAAEKFLVVFRCKLGPWRWLLVLISLFLPICFLQFTDWGYILHGSYVRLLMAVVSVVISAWLITKKNAGFIDWESGLIILVLASGLYNAFASFTGVTSYPFSLGWSEGNRLWDYSILFKSAVYNYPSSQRIPVYLDIGRQFLGGIPFLFSRVHILQVRFWNALMDVIPYLLLGWAAFRLPRRNTMRWVLVGIWAFVFVKQGSIHPPLLVCAIIVALAWEQPLWLAVPLIFVDSLFAEISRFTWLFAPGMWAVMLEMGGAVLQNNILPKRVWWRSVAVGLTGILGGYVAPFFIPASLQWMVNPMGVSGSNVGGVTASTVGASLSSQALLWYRLFPNATYGYGILVGLLLAVLPLILILVYLPTTKRWELNGWQIASLVVPLSAFLAVGLIASIKIGGGGDLHNLDMFLIGLMFTATIAWRRGGQAWIASPISMSVWMRGVIIVMLVLPAYRPLKSLSPLAISGKRQVVATLADITIDPLPDPLPDTLPNQNDTSEGLAYIRKAIADALPHGDVLFMDQRQLLTFGFINDVPLVPDYDKKVLIDKALSNDAQYFDHFYRDLASHRFSLIITSPLNKRLDSEGDQFGEENNAWVKWVTTPTLCYYQPLETDKKVNVQLLVPNANSTNCASAIP